MNPVNIDPERVNCHWQGWGTSLCWWAKEFGKSKDLAYALFSMGATRIGEYIVPGLGMNVVRYNAGACSAEMPFSSSAKIWPERIIGGYWRVGEDSEPGSWNWDADPHQRGMLLMAKNLGANVFELFSNSPMWWMCKNHNPAGARDGTDNLQESNFGKHAEYLATIVEHAGREWGISFNSVSPFNEPSSKWWRADNNQEGCHFDVANQAEVIRHLRQELDSRCLGHVDIATSDENQYDEALETWSNFTSGTREMVGQVNVHGYQKQGGRRDLLRKETNGKRLWNSEYGDDDVSGLSMAQIIHLDFRWLSPAVWCYWQPIDGSNWGMFDWDTLAVNPKFHVMAQYSRHIRPGMQVLEVDDDSTIAALDTLSRKLVIVALNLGEAKELTYNLELIQPVPGPVRRWITEPKSGLFYKDSRVDVLDTNQLWFSISSNSVHTYEIDY